MHVVYAHVFASASTRSNCATCESMPDAYTNRPSGDEATANTSAACCLKVYSLVPNLPSQNVTSPSLLPLTIVPSGR